MSRQCIQTSSVLSVCSKELVAKAVVLGRRHLQETFRGRDWTGSQESAVHACTKVLISQQFCRLSVASQASAHPLVFSKTLMRIQTQISAKDSARTIATYGPRCSESARKGLNRSETGQATMFPMPLKSLCVALATTTLQVRPSLHPPGSLASRTICNEWFLALGYTNIIRLILQHFASSTGVSTTTRMPRHNCHQSLNIIDTYILLSLSHRISTQKNPPPTALRLPTVGFPKRYASAVTRSQ